MNDSGAIAQPVPLQRGALRIAVVTETYPPEINGVAVTIKLMVDGLRRRGHSIHLIRPRQGDGDWISRAPLLEETLVRGFPMPGYEAVRIGLPCTSALRRLWSARPPDLVHIVTEGPLGRSGVNAAAALGLPCSSDFHTNFHTYTRDYGVAWLNRPIAAYLRRLHNRAGCTIVPTDSLRDELKKDGYLNLRVVARGVDSALFNPARRSEALRRLWGADPGDLVCICVGRAAPEKNLAMLLRAFRAIKEVRNDARLVVVGDGPERGRLQKQAPDVLFAGMRTGKDLATHYASGDLFLFPSTSETYGNVTVEAMASGLAVVAYGYAAAAQHIVHGRTGVLARFDHEDEFIAHAVDLARDPARMAALGRAARQAAEKIDWETVHDAFEKVLLKIASARATARQPVGAAA